MRRSRGRWRALAVAAALAAGGAPAGVVHAQSAAVTGQVMLNSGQLGVAVATDFPRVVSYTDLASGAVIGGRSSAVTSVTLNGTAYPVTVAVTGQTTTSVSYTLSFAALSGVQLDASLSVQGRVVTFRVDAVRDTTVFRVGTIDIPGQDLISVASTDAGAATAFTTLSPDSTTTADRFASVTGSTAADANPVGASYALLNTGKLAAAIESNSTYDKPSGATDRDAARFWHQARKQSDGSVRVGVWSGQWTYRGAGSPFTEELPWAKVVITPDANGDGVVDWQDGAVAFRSIGVVPDGASETKDRVVAHIPFNFASQATHPFLRTLDDVKRVSLATDGLGQLAILKGYQSEGHDSAHPDYGGNYNTRAGGLADLNELLRDGKQWGASFGVHVNATEAYPVANNFSSTLVDPSAKGWNWLDQSYYIDQRKDLTGGGLAARFQQLRNETDSNLEFLYMDVYYTHGWTADRTLTELRKQGWQLGTEWADKFERGSLWSHWANDLNYGGASNKGLNSKIIRFIRNDQKDVWNSDPILDNARIVEAEGWTGHQDWTAFTANIWQHNLPAKYLQHYRITNWGAKDITFTGGVRGTTANGNKREVYDGAAKVIDGNAYLLPWWDQTSGQQNRLYHWNPAGGSSTWTVPPAFASATGFDVYALGDNGRTKVATVPVSAGKVTLTATAGKAYVLYPSGSSLTPPIAQWGQGTPVRDPGFNGELAASWQTSGPVSVQTDGLGGHTAVLGGGGEAVLQQTLTGLQAGKSYSASAWIEVAPGQTRHTTLTAGGQSVAVDRSALTNYVAADEKHGTNFQRAKVLFTVPSGQTTATLAIRAAAGSATVRVDDLRVVRDDVTTKAGTVAYEDFEAVDQGWGPFVKGDAGGSTDPRTHIAQLHAPYTQAGWNGKLTDDVLGGSGQSLKSHEENDGLVYRTAPWTVNFQPGHNYRVEYDYQSSNAASYAWVTGYDKANGGAAETHSTAIGQQRQTAHFSEQLTAGCGDTWVGLRKVGGAPAGADFVLDNFTVTDLGVASGSACVSWLPKTGMTVTGVDSSDDATGGQAANAIDGDTTTQWHTAWSQVSTPPPYPHWITVDLGASYDLSAVGYLPRQDGGTNGIIKSYQIYVSSDGVNWGSAVAAGDFATSGTAEQTVPVTARGRYVKLLATASRNGAAFASAAELDFAGVVVP